MRSVPFSCLVFVVMLIALGAIFLWVPTEKEMGIVQRIFYFHVPAAFSSFLAFFFGVRRQCTVSAPLVRTNGIAWRYAPPN